MKYRSRTEIAAQILEAANGGVTKTRIMYSAFLSYQQLKDYLSVLMENGLIECNRVDQLYKTTDKGRKFLNLYDEISQFVSAGPDYERMPRKSLRTPKS